MSLKLKLLVHDEKSGTHGYVISDAETRQTTLIMEYTKIPKLKILSFKDLDGNDYAKVFLNKAPYVIELNGTIGETTDKWLEQIEYYWIEDGEEFKVHTIIFGAAAMT